MKKLIIIFLFLFSFASAEENRAIKISGYMFGDAYWMHANHDSSLVDRNGFWFRRVYLTFEKAVTGDLDVRLRFEMGSKGDFSTHPALLVPFIKDAWLRWRINTNHSLYFGISEPPSFRVVERYWGHRYIEKTPEDIQKIASSRDFGVALRGKIEFVKGLNYHFMLGNGSGNKSEINTGKKIMASVFYNITGKLIIDIYADYNKSSGENYYYTWHIFSGYKGKVLNLGFLYSNQVHKTASATNYRLGVFSGYVTYKLMDQWSLILRGDRNFYPNPSGHKILYLPFDDTASNYLLIGGIEYSPLQDIRITPNLETVIYDENSSGEVPGTDLITRVTIYYEF